MPNRDYSVPSTWEMPDDIRFVAAPAGWRIVFNVAFSGAVPPVKYESEPIAGWIFAPDSDDIWSWHAAVGGEGFLAIEIDQIYGVFGPGECPGRLKLWWKSRQSNKAHARFAGAQS